MDSIKAQLSSLKFPLIAALLAGLAVLSGCQSSPEQMEVARVDGNPVHLEEVMQSKQFESLVRNAALNRVLEQKAKEAGVSVSEEEINSRIEEIRNQQNVSSDLEWRNMVLENFYSEENLRKRLRSNMLMRKLAENRIDLSDEKLREEWDSRQQFYKQLYVQRNQLDLSQEERQNLEFEEVKSFIRETLKQQQTRSKMQELSQELQNDTDIKLTYLPSDVRQERQSVEEKLAQQQEGQQEAMQENREQVAGGSDDVRASERPPSAGSGQAQGGQSGSQQQSGGEQSGEQGSGESGSQSGSEGSGQSGSEGESQESGEGSGQTESGEEESGSGESESGNSDESGSGDSGSGNGQSS